MLYPVKVEKSYIDPESEYRGRQTFTGTIQVEADSADHAKEIVCGWMNPFQEHGCLQTTDPRIQWEEDYDLFDLTDDGWEYEDWSFGLADEEQTA